MPNFTPLHFSLHMFDGLSKFMCMQHPTRHPLKYVAYTEFWHLAQISWLRMLWLPSACILFDYNDENNKSIKKKMSQTAANSCSVVLYRAATNLEQRNKKVTLRFNPTPWVTRCVCSGFSLCVWCDWFPTPCVFFPVKQNVEVSRMSEEALLTVPAHQWGSAPLPLPQPHSSLVLYVHTAPLCHCNKAPSPTVHRNTPHFNQSFFVFEEYFTKW